MNVGSQYNTPYQAISTDRRDDSGISKKCRITVIALSIILATGAILTILFLKKGEEGPGRPSLPPNCTEMLNCSVSN
jgi:hypothetical protein